MVGIMINEYELHFDISEILANIFLREVNKYNYADAIKLIITFIFLYEDEYDEKIKDFTYLLQDKIKYTDKSYFVSEIINLLDKENHGTSIRALKLKIVDIYIMERKRLEEGVKLIEKELERYPNDEELINKLLHLIELIPLEFYLNNNKQGLVIENNNFVGFIAEEGEISIRMGKLDFWDRHITKSEFCVPQYEHDNYLKSRKISEPIIIGETPFLTIQVKKGLQAGKLIIKYKKV
ncbi:MAG: hypothetical protein U5L00_07255 [Desulfovermiculus sp.]|nr:hypothetical protein [Desulfovermiculus sp.]